ncbi:hypothetical protein C8A05DRAFT_39897 [Staphylotrichum tortipilum]|uniref:Uncharacterized protein n=1 Tax=Staphylotrichum tortipilum TaxID=2831512 RepID=A0AAN6MAN1_9PEZI|nr:hypothetical protein C8A05DRAFT_39897 [Staphylotrichum longicolle]
MQAPGAYWKGFSSPPSYEQGTLETSPPSHGRLKTLSISWTIIHPRELSDWHARSDFRHLRRLDLNSVLSLETLASLHAMAVDHKFDRLEALGMIIHAEEPDEDPLLDEPTSRFLHALPPLKELAIRHDFRHLTFDAILRRHGPALRKPTLLPMRPHDLKDPSTTPPLGDSDIARAIADGCPVVEDLALRVQRRQGSSEEAAVYRALGRLPRNLPPRVVLANTAVDEALARGIFAEMLWGAEEGRSRLVRLGLRPDDAWLVNGIGMDDVEMMCLWLVRKWNCARDVVSGEGRVKDLTTEEDDAHDREQMLSDDLEDMEEEAAGAWKELWPLRGGDWRDEWKSLPLQTGGLDGREVGEEVQASTE